MRRRVVLFSLICVSLTYVNAQIARWVIPAEFDTVYSVEGSDLIFAHRSDSTFIFDKQGKPIDTTEFFIYPFKDKKAVTVKQKQRDNVTGFYDNKGKFIKVTEEYFVDTTNPYFYDGFLLVKEANHRYRFINSKGHTSKDFYFEAYPFNQGNAMCRKVKEKAKIPSYVCIDTALQERYFTKNRKEIEDRDIQFMSSLSDEGKGVIIFNDYAYYYTNKSDELKEITFFVNKDNRKVSIDNPKPTPANNIYVLYGRVKKNNVNFLFDRNFIPLSIECDSVKVEFKVKYPQLEPEYHSDVLRTDKDRKGKYNLIYKDKEILVPQFDAVKFIPDDNIIVCKNKSWGMLAVDKNKDFHFSINKEQEVRFLHERFDASVEVKVPNYVSVKNANLTRLLCDERSGLTIDKYAERKIISDLNDSWIMYQCQLQIPGNIKVDTFIEIDYPITLIYDSLVYPTQKVKIKASRLNYLDIKLDKENDSIFEMNIVQDIPLNNHTPMYNIKVITDCDSTLCNIDKQTNQRYRAEFSYLRSGITNVTIILTEDSCPPLEFQYTIDYVPAKTNNRGVVKENAKITVQKKKKDVVRGQLFESN